MLCDDSIQNNRIIDKIAIFFIAALNSAMYIIGNYAHQNVLVHANLEKYYFIFFWASLTISPISRFLNSLFISLNFRYDICIIVFCCLMEAGLLSSSFSFNFWTVNISVIFINFSASFIDSSILSYITNRKKQSLLNVYTLGVSLTGLISAGYSYLCVKIEVSLFYTFISFVFFPPLCFVLFFGILARSPQSNLPNSTPQDVENNDQEDNSGIHQRMLDDLSENPHEKSSGNLKNNIEEQNIDINDNINNEFKTFLCDYKIFRSSWLLILSCSVCFFLYRAINGFIKLYGLKFEMDDPYAIPYMYLCFQIGFFIAICTIWVAQFQNIWIFMVAQIILFILTVCQTFIHFTKNLIFTPLMFIFGLCCGFPYINSLYFLMNDDTKSVKQRELAVSWNLFFLSLSIVLSTIFLYIFQLYY